MSDTGERIERDVLVAPSARTMAITATPELLPSRQSEMEAASWIALAAVRLVTNNEVDHRFRAASN